MKKITTALIAVWLTVVPCLADGLDYPCQKLIQKNEFAKAHSEISALLLKKPEDLSVIYAAFCLYFAEENPNRNIEQAYRYACKGKDITATKKDKETAKMMGKGYTRYVFEYAIDRCVRHEIDVAKQTDTPEAFQAIKVKFPDCSSSLRTMLKDGEETAAYHQACAANTIEAYEAFIRNYPKSKLVEKAQWNIHESAYNELARYNSRKARTDYLMRYPDSHRCLDVLNSLYPAPYREDELDESTYWAYRQLTDMKENEPVSALLMQRSLMRYAQRSKNFYISEYGAKHFVTPIRDSCWLVLHDVFMECNEVDKFKYFYDQYPNKRFPDIVRHDSIVIREGRNPNSVDFIKAAAPYPLAYDMMVENIAEFVNKGKWEDAAAYCAQFSEAFGDDRRYKGLMDVLTAPIDKAIIRQRLPNTINTKDGEEYTPILSFDGQSMYFTARYRKDNIGKEDIFVTAKNKKGQWAKPQVVSALSTYSGNEAPEAISTDETELIFFQNGKLLSSQRTETGWGKPQPLSENINIAKWQADVMLTSDGKAMLFTAQKGTSREAYVSRNIFVSLKDSAGNWSKPIELGPSINTARSERTAYLHPDMTTLYFSSEGHSYLGELDVFKSTRLNPNSWTEWSEPVNLGKQVNTTDDDWGYKISTDGKTAYFSADNDLYSMDMPENMRPNPVVAISGYVTDNAGNVAKVAVLWHNDDLDIDAGTIKITTDDRDGAYFYVLQPGYIYSYSVNDDNYQPYRETIDLRGINEMTSKEVNIRLTPIKKSGVGMQKVTED